MVKSSTILIAYTVFPVSYTHLDVYKRQSHTHRIVDRILSVYKRSTIFFNLFLYIAQRRSPSGILKSVFLLLL